MRARSAPFRKRRRGASFPVWTFSTQAEGVRVLNIKHLKCFLSVIAICFVTTLSVRPMLAKSGFGDCLFYPQHGPRSRMACCSIGEWHHCVVRANILRDFRQR